MRAASLADHHGAICDAYADGEPISSLTRNYDISQTHLYRILHRAGVAFREPAKGATGPPLSGAQERELIEAYRRGTPRTELARRYQCSGSRVDRILRDANVVFRDPVEAHVRRYPLRHDAFRDLTPTSAYWAGLLMADGCIARNRTVQLSLHRDDAEHLHEFHAFLGCPTRPIVVRDNLATSHVHSTELVADLIRLGIVPRKSYGATASKSLATFSSFWLGMLDGDGSVFFSRGPTVSLCGSRSLMKQYRDFIAERALGRKQAVSVRGDGLCSVVVEGRSAQAVLELLYQDGLPALPRKRKLAEEALRWECARPRDPVFAADKATQRREIRELWMGSSSPHTWHSAKLDDVAEQLLESRGFRDITRWRPAARSSMVAFEAVEGDEPVVVWVTSRPKAAVPPAVSALNGRALRVLHACPRDPDRSVITAPIAGSSSVPLAALREFALELRRATESTTSLTREQ